ncbi:MAG: Txe/YoeB family addiction module toxin [Acidobacteria bacterium]|nr:Txe/YoeB family addiction module toxin [Acidobacteriota bacterium]
MRRDCFRRYGGQELGTSSPGTQRSCEKRSSVKRTARRVAIFQPEFLQHLRFWVKSERPVALRGFDLVDAILRDPFEGVGKPEPLKHVLSGCLSRRITQEHRLVYRVTDEAVDFLQARYHY